MSEQVEQLNAAVQAFGIALRNFVQKLWQAVYSAIAPLLKWFAAYFGDQQRVQRFIRRHRHEVDIIVRHSRSKA